MLTGQTSISAFSLGMLMSTWSTIHVLSMSLMKLVHAFIYSSMV